MYKESIKKVIEMLNVKYGLIKLILKMVVFINLISLQLQCEWMNEWMNKRMNPFYFLFISSDDVLSVSSGGGCVHWSTVTFAPAKLQWIHDSSARGRCGHSGRLKKSRPTLKAVWFERRPAASALGGGGRRWQEVLKSPESHALRYLALPPLRDLDVEAVK